MKYCESIYQTKRRKTREVKVGKVGIGGDNPLRIQSMTTTSTRDVNGTVEQVIALADAGCEIVRLTVQGIKEAQSCEEIKNVLVKRGYSHIPLVADIHFYPPAAMHVVEFVDKIRINPGNFVDRRAIFQKKEYDDASYQLELEKIEEIFSPLVEKCKYLKKSMRIGTNHGSLSDRIMNRYGDTPLGMVESALEFTRICRKMDYHDLVFSMKASNPAVMIHAYRLLVAEMERLFWDYPLHLGVTEAGAGEEGRIKSAVGIGALLVDGLGDTLRISLTEAPQQEIPPCRALIAYASQCFGKGTIPFEEKHRNFQALMRPKIIPAVETSLHRDGSVVLYVKEEELAAQVPGKGNHGPHPDILFVPYFHSPQLYHEILQQLKAAHIDVVTYTPGIVGTTLLCDLKEVKDPQATAIWVSGEEEELWERLKEYMPHMIFFAPSQSPVHCTRRFINWLRTHHLNIPIILAFEYESADLIIQASAELGALLVDGLGDGICICSNSTPEHVRSLSFNILQAARMRMVKTDYISCPGCGRTLFDLQQVSERIRARTGHLPGVKIAIMGCIVNGPGEMADADFGYVGSRPGKVDLYVGKACVERGIDTDQADDRLVALLQAHGRWQEPN